MQEFYRKGIASHPDPRSCGRRREATTEAWIGASTGWAIERRKAAIGVPTLLDFSGRPHGVGRYRESAADPASSKTPGTSRNFLHENRETSEMSDRFKRPDREVKAPGRTASMYVSEESDHVIVPRNPLNKDGHPSAERGEGSAWTEENARPFHTHPTQRGARVPQGLARVRKIARERRQEQFTALLHHLTVDLLRDSFYALQRHAAPGVDHLTWQEYATGLEARLADLHDRVHRGTYRAHPSRRVYIPKPDGRQRPLGIAALEDKIVQQAVVTILSQIYEEDFRGFSYGFRPGRSPHHALDALSVALTRKCVNYVLDCDIRGFFDTLSHEWLVKFLQHRVVDPRILRLIQKWLRAGVSEEGQWSETPVGVPQGAVVSPLLANVYLHYVFDLWVEAWRKGIAQGDMVVVRFADDFVLGFEYRNDAERFLAALRDRLHRFGLELHTEKTRLIEFGPHAIANRKQRGEGKPETFDFLGFTHICERHRKTGYFTVRRKTARKRMGAKLKALNQQLRQRRHEPIAITGQWLGSIVQGYFNYHAVPGNMRTLGTFRRRVIRLWRRQLRLRSQKTRLNWRRFKVLIHRWIPTQRILHPFPSVRFDAMHPR
jgi:RNA-directed DNA polymerase